MSTVLRIADLPRSRRRDRGGILVFVLVAVTICSFIAIPMLSYITSVLRSGEVQADRTQAVELANGGTWVALSNQRGLYELCAGGDPGPTPGPVVDLESSLPDVSTTCQVLDTAPLRSPGAVPFHVSAIQVGKVVPSQLQTSQTYTNPNTAATPGAWRAQAAPEPANGKVWIPNLPVQATSIGGSRDLAMPAGTQDPGFSSCRVFFPGTFNDPITIDSAAYFTSGVYYFTAPITLRDGADVVVGNGSELGCTNEYEAIANLPEAQIPTPLNVSGLGGTFVLGDDARITVDDSGSGDIRFAINQRYVSTSETSVKASSDVAIVSVNGMHAPFASGEAIGQDFRVAGTIEVPGSRVGTDGNPSATVGGGYAPSTLTVKPTKPDAPTNVKTEVFQRSLADTFTVADGAIKVTWDVPNANGALITKYVATDETTGRSCSPATPVTPATTVQPSCAIYNLPHQEQTDPERPKIRVTAQNSYGTSEKSAAQTTAEAGRVDLRDPGQSPVFEVPQSPPSASFGTSYTNGLEVRWTAPASNTGRLPITGYRVEARVGTGPILACEARWDETSCVLPLPTNVVPNPTYAVKVFSVNDEATPRVKSADRTVGNRVYVPGTQPAPVKTAATAPPRVPDAIVDFTTSTNTKLDVVINGYVSVPQGRIAISAFTPANLRISMTGGVVAGDFFLDPAGIPTGELDVQFDNPVAQKRVRIISRHNGDAEATSDAIIQVNRSGSIGINSWVVQ